MPDLPHAVAAPVTIDQVGCARCGGDGHPGLTFRPLTHPLVLNSDPQDLGDPIVLSYWAPCPANGEPILMWIGDRKDAPGGS